MTAAFDSGRSRTSSPATAPTLAEQVAVARIGQSAYTEPGRLSWAQRQAHTDEMLGFLVEITDRAAYTRGFEAGREAGRLEAWRRVGPHALAGLIAEDFDRIRRDLADLGVDER